MDRGADLLDVAQLRMPPFPEELARLQLRVVEDLIVGPDVGAGHARLLHQRHPVRPRLARRHLFDHRDEDVPPRVARGVVLETLVARPLRVVEDIAERPPVAWSGGADSEVAVGGADRLVGRRSLVGGTQRPWNLSGREEAPSLPNRQRYSRLEERHVDELPATGQLAYTQRREGADRAVQGADKIADRHADLDRVAVRLTGDRNQPTHRLGHDVEPRQLRVRTGLAPARGGDVDQAGIERRKTPVVELEVAHRARSQVLDHDVRAMDQLPKELLAFGRLEVQGE